MVEDLCAFFDDEGDGPGEEVHEVRKEVGMWALDELLNVKGIVLSGIEVT